jgi:hypothetical protein
VTAEAIAAVVADLRAGRVAHLTRDHAMNTALLARAQQPQPVVDITAIYASVVERATSVGVDMYGDFPTATSPWDEALFAYVNRHGNVMVMQVHQEPWTDDRRWETGNPVEWDRVRWLVEATIWHGGRGGDGRAVPTGGPVRLLQHAVYDDGSPGDMHWVALSRAGESTEVWEMPTVALTAALNFLGCSNVEVAEPKRPFPVRQRLRKTRVQVQTIVVRPPGKRSQRGGSGFRPVDELDVPLTSVRGSFGHFGEQYGRGLLFGKLSGKFWRPAHARGAGEGGQKNYVLKPDRESVKT